MSKQVLVRVGCVVVAMSLLGCRRATSAPGDQEAGRARVERQTKAAQIAPAPLPAALPLVGPDGVDADGYPLKWVDRAAMRSLLLAKRYDQLTRYFEELQAAFEADPKKEYWINDAAAAFDSAEPELLASLDEWVQASAGSFAPVYARGAHRVHLGFVRRGTKWSAETPMGDQAAMDDAMKKALFDLAEARARRPKLAATYAFEVSARMVRSDRAGVDRAAAQAAELCASCLLFRVQVLHALEPRWGGSYEQMAAYAKSAPVARNPRLRVLPAYLELDRADQLRREGRLDEALAATERACALGEYWKSRLERALTYERKKDLASAARDVARADELRPLEPQVLFERARIALAQQHWETAGQTLVAGLRIDPTNAAGRDLLPYVVQGLQYESGQQLRAGHKEDALRSVELALGLDPQNRNAVAQKVVLLGGAVPDSSEELDKLRAAATASPNDLRAHQALDYALARQHRFTEVIEMWTRYLADHSRDGMAHLERGGAYYNLGRRDEARSDAQAACDLGVSEGCARAKMMH